MELDLSALIADLRRAGGDTTAIEVKSAAGGLPESLTSTLSALANLPGGGTIILGLDERLDFQPVPLSDPQKLKQGLAAKSRTYLPPIRLDIEDATVDSAPVIAARVHECDPSAKPCRSTVTGKAYLRSFDGDYPLSDLEEQAFLAARRPPLFDRAPVEGATVGDLDPDLLGGFIAGIREEDPQGRGRFQDDMELLRRNGVIDGENRPTVAGLLALGVHPQQWFPRYVIQAAAEPPQGAPPGTRARNQRTITGPIPRMLDGAMAWARQTFDSFIIGDPDGNVRDQYEYPLPAFRELIANALIHRDLDHWSSGMAVEVRLRRDRLIIGNPGGLYGITVDRLGRDSVTSARNSLLVSICQHVRSAETGVRAIEALASGIPTVTSALATAGLPAAHFIDTGIRFVVDLRKTPPESTQPSAREREILNALATGPQTAPELAERIGLPIHTVRRLLNALRQAGHISRRGGQGRLTTYDRIPGK